VNVVDSSGWLEYFIDGPRADTFAPIIEDHANLIVPSISIYEVFKKVYAGKGEDKALETVAIMYGGTIVDLTKEIALSAAQLSHEHKLPMADSVILATARAYHATLWSQDADFKSMDGVNYFEKIIEKTD
jgi:predicted nucleic acid-binding protein